jgi:hypothetical protein
MLAEIYMLRLEAAARATAKEAATTPTMSSSQFVPISLPALPDPNIGLRLANIKRGMTTA